MVMEANEELVLTPDVKLSEMLQKLIEDAGLSRQRKKLCRAIEISPSALSQYIHGQSRPSMDTLIRLATYFGVSLDYLVFARASSAQPAEVDYGPLARFIDLSLARSAEKTALHSSLVGRIGRALGEQIDKTAEDMLSKLESGIGSGGLLSDEDTLALEEYSLETLIVSMNLQYDVISVEDESEAPGRFLPVVGRNLAAGKSYRFVLPKAVRPWKPVVATFKKLLRDFAAADAIAERCEFRVWDGPAYSGCGLYRLDVPEMRLSNPVLLEALEGSVDKDGWMGYVIPASSELQADCVMDALHLEQAKRGFKLMWDHAKPA